MEPPCQDRYCPYHPTSRESEDAVIVEPRCQDGYCSHPTHQIRKRTLDDGDWKNLQPCCQLCYDERKDKKARFGGGTTETLPQQRSLVDDLLAAENPEDATTVLSDISTEVADNTAAYGDEETLKAVLQTMTNYLLHPRVYKPTHVTY